MCFYFVLFIFTSITNNTVDAFWRSSHVDILRDSAERFAAFTFFLTPVCIICHAFTRLQA